jgi:sugar phosphate isomerase/epimerase
VKAASTTALGRRRFVRHSLMAGGALIASPLDRVIAAAQAKADGPAWTARLGLQVYTVRDRLAKDFDGTLAAVAAAGYKEVELFGSLGELTPQQVRAILDRHGLTSPSTHISASPGPDLEKQLAGWQIIGHRFTQVRAAGPPGPRGGGAPAPANTAERWKRQAQLLNEVGAAGKKFGIRALMHNHVEEFIPIPGGTGSGYDILLAETDPALVAMELDLGWARIAGQDPIAMFKKHPGRYPLWHVKDTTGLAAAVARPFPERQRAASFVPVGSGDIDYKVLFAHAQTAGLQHFFIEQDNAVDGDSIAAIRTSAQNLKKILG